MDRALQEEGSHSLAQDFVHFEHVNFVHSEYCSETRVAHNFSLVARILQFVPLDIIP